MSGPNGEDVGGAVRELGKKLDALTELFKQEREQSRQNDRRFEEGLAQMARSVADMSVDSMNLRALPELLEEQKRTVKALERMETSLVTPATSKRQIDVDTMLTLFKYFIYGFAALCALSIVAISGKEWVISRDSLQTKTHDVSK